MHAASRADGMPKEGTEFHQPSKEGKGESDLKELRQSIAQGPGPAA